MSVVTPGLILSYIREQVEQASKHHSSMVFPPWLPSVATVIVLAAQPCFFLFLSVGLIAATEELARTLHFHLVGNIL